MFCAHCGMELPENSTCCPQCQSQQANTSNTSYAPVYSLSGKKNMAIALILAYFFGGFALLFYAPPKKGAMLIGIEIACTLLFYLVIGFTGNQYVASLFLLIAIVPHFVAIFWTYRAVKKYNDDLAKKYMAMPYRG